MGSPPKNPSRRGKGAPTMGIYRPLPVIGTWDKQAGMGIKKRQPKKREKVYY